MPRADLVHLPVHPGRAPVVNLHPVHPDIPLAGVGVLRVDSRQRDEPAAVLRPAFQDRQILEGKTLPALIESVNHLFARAIRDALRPGVQQVDALFEQRPRLPH